MTATLPSVRRPGGRAFERPAPAMAAAVLVCGLLAGAACGDPASPEDPGPAATLDDLVTLLRDAGAAVQVGDALSGFLGSGRLVAVNTQSVSVYVFRSVLEARVIASRVSPRGDQLRSPDGRETVNIFWVNPPHFFRWHALIVLYVGLDPDLLDLLTGLLGPQFAGG